MSRINIKNAPGDQSLAPHVAWFLYDGYVIENYMEYFTATERVKQGNMSNNASPLLTPSNSF